MFAQIRPDEIPEVPQQKFLFRGSKEEEIAKYGMQLLKITHLCNFGVKLVTVETDILHVMMMYVWQLLVQIICAPVNALVYI